MTRPFRWGNANRAREWKVRRLRGPTDGPRLRGVCDACGEEHPFPDTRYYCPLCGVALCGLLVVTEGYVEVHSECGTRVVVVEEEG